MPPHRLALLAALAVVASAMGCKEATFGPELFGSIQGRVVDFETGASLSNALISTSPPSSTLLTDGSGAFTIDNISAGSYSITATRSGYESNTATVAVQQNRVTPAVIFLRQEDPADTTGQGDDAFSAEVLSFMNVPRPNNDSSFVRVEYRVRNLGDVAIPNYELYFRLETAGTTFFHERSGVNLDVGQTDIQTFDKVTLGAMVTGVTIEDFWYTGQTPPLHAGPGRR